MYSEFSDHCPACLSQKVTDNYLFSKDRHMSVPGMVHSLCHGCNTVFLNPKPTTEELNKFYLSSTTESSVREIVIASVKRVLEDERIEYFRTEFIGRNWKTLTQRCPTNGGVDTVSLLDIKILRVCGQCI